MRERSVGTARKMSVSKPYPTSRSSTRVTRSIKTELTAICGSDLHLYSGNIPTMKAGDILGHEFLGEAVELRRGVSNLQTGRPSDRAVPYRVRQLLLLRARIIFFCDNPIRTAD